MKYIKLYENYQTEEDIHRICAKFSIENYTINSDMSIDVDGDVEIYGSDIIKLPLKFRTVTGYFSCFECGLETLENAPSYVGGQFMVGMNKLTSLKYCPEYIGEHFDCSRNMLTSLEYCPKIINGHLNCHVNEIESFDNAPTEIKSNLNISNNKLTTLLGCPIIGNLTFVIGNPLPEKILSFVQLYNSNKLLLNQDEYGIWNNDGSFNEKRFDILLSDVKKGMFD